MDGCGRSGGWFVRLLQGRREREMEDGQGRSCVEGFGVWRGGYGCWILNRIVECVRVMTGRDRRTRCWWRGRQWFEASRAVLPERCYLINIFVCILFSVIGWLYLLLLFSLFNPIKVNNIAV